VRKRVRLVLGLGVLTILLVACQRSSLPQDTFNAQGPNAQEIKNLFIPVLLVAAVVFVLVEGGFVWIMVRYRHRKGRDRIPAQTHGNTKLEITWTIIPTLILAGVMVPTVATIWDLASAPPANAMHVTVEGHQWWWGFDYTDPDMRTLSGTPIRTADVLVIPVGQPVYLSLEAASTGGAHSDPMPGAPNGVPDYTVIHSFWVPELAGKQDVVPGRTNHILLQANHPGVYDGQCAEFCGYEHAFMRFRVDALDQTSWTAWMQNQKANAVAPIPGSQAALGQAIFLRPTFCIQCHLVNGLPNTSSAAIDSTTFIPTAPNLTHFFAAEHSCSAGCVWDTHDPKAIAAWLRDPSAIKPYVKMPNYHLSNAEIQELVAYLQSLK
jgi:cytochrome c oxidase subunit 2